MKMVSLVKIVLVIGIVVAGSPAIASTISVGCNNFGKLRSKNSNTPTKIRFVNERDETVRIFWLDFGGAMRFYAEVEAGATLLQPTYLTHPWIILDNTGNCTGPFMPRPSLRVVTIQ
jgi:von Hippel-Lindau disease tumor supressor